jgi:hypothetical protein
MAMYSSDADGGFDYSTESGRSKQTNPPLRSRRKPPTGRKRDAVASNRGIHRRRNKRINW